MSATPALETVARLQVTVSSSFRKETHEAMT
jgi:hypothetical protein